MEFYETFSSHEAMSDGFSMDYHFGIEDPGFLKSPRGNVSAQTAGTDTVFLDSNDYATPTSAVYNGYRSYPQHVQPYITQAWPQVWHTTFPFPENESEPVGEPSYYAVPLPSINTASSLRQVQQDQMNWDKSASKPEKGRHPRLDPSQIQLLGSWLEANPSNLYPNRDEKERLATSTGLELKQVEAWFSRIRRKKAKTRTPTRSAHESSWSRLDLRTETRRDYIKTDAATREEDTGIVFEVKSQPCQSACSHSSLCVLKSSVGDDERSQNGLSKRWSESHLPHTLEDEPENITPFQGWPDSHLSWWLEHSNQKVPDRFPSYQRSPTANKMRFKDQYLIDVARLHDINAITPSDILVPPLILGESNPGRRDRSCGSSMSGVSRFSGRSRSSQKYPAARGLPVNGYPASSVLSLASFDSSRSRQHCTGNSDSSMLGNVSVPKRRKLTNSSAVSVDSAVTCSSEVSHLSKDRRQGRRTFETSRHPPMSRKVDLQENKFWCTFCDMTFKDKYRWQRHEESTHCSPHVWICRPQPPKFLQGSLFSQPWTTLYSAASEQCWSKPPHIRTFYRKDAMIQHLTLVHKSDITSGPPNVIVDNLKIKVAVDIEVLRCQFCQHLCATWEDRVAHLSHHFENETRVRRLNLKGAPKSWQQPHKTSLTSFPDLERFVLRGRIEDISHPYQWRCPACSYSTYSSPSMPYIHACNYHWDELHELALPQPDDYAGHINFGHVQPPSQPSTTLEYDCMFQERFPDAGSDQIVEGWKKSTSSVVDKIHHPVEVPQLGMHRLRRR